MSEWISPDWRYSASRDTYELTDDRAALERYATVHQGLDGTWIWATSGDYPGTDDILGIDRGEAADLDAARVAAQRSIGLFRPLP